MVGRCHYLAALGTVTPASQRAIAPTSAPLPPHLAPLLAQPLLQLLSALALIFPPAAAAAASASAASAADGGATASSQSAASSTSSAAAGPYRGSAATLCTDLGGTAYPAVCRPHLLVHGAAHNGQAPLGLAAMHALERCQLYAIDAAALAADGSGRSASEACAHVFAEARKTLPAVVLLPAVDGLLRHAEPALYATLRALVANRPASLPLLVLGTCEAPLASLPPTLQTQLRCLFPLDHYEVAPPPQPRRAALIELLLADVARGPPVPPPPPAAPAQLQKAPPPPKPRPSERELRAAREEERTLRR